MLERGVGMMIEQKNNTSASKWGQLILGTKIKNIFKGQKIFN